jgi:hypothetical protein
MNQGTPEIRLDTSRPFSTIHGERNPEDPHYHVHSFQDGLPFSADETLVPDDGRTGTWTEALEREDGTTRIVRHRALYTDKMRALVAKRLKKLSSTKRVVPKAAPALDDEGDEVAPQLEFGADEVNLISWLKGEIKYTPNEVFAAVKNRHGIALTRLREVVAHLVDDEKLLPEAQVSPHLLALLDEAASAAA